VTATGQRLDFVHNLDGGFEAEPDTVSVNGFDALEGRMPGYRHTVSILRLDAVGSPDEWNVPTQVWVTLTTTQRALVQERAGREVQVPDRAGPAISTGLIFLPIETDVTEHDVIVLGSEEWDVLAVRDGGGAGHHLEIDAERVRL
jgi:hypothetical protein